MFVLASLPVYLSWLVLALFKACFLLVSLPVYLSWLAFCWLFCFVKNRIKKLICVFGYRGLLFIVVVAVLSSLPVYLLWLVFIPALSRIE